MNIFSQIKILPEFLMNTYSSVFLASDNVITSMLSADNLITRLLKVLLQLFYFASKWVMYMVDVIYFYIMQLAGISVDTSIFDSAQSDATFKLLIDNKDMVTTIIKNFIVIAIILIIVTAVIAIIRQQSLALKEKKAKKGQTEAVLKSVFKSVLLIILTPMIAIVGIVASSVILQSLFNATNLSQTKSLSARVFNVSASAASKYRTYAENGVRIPIKYKFKQTDESDFDRANNAVSYTVKMIGEKRFPSLDYFELNANFNGLELKDPVNDKPIVSKNHASGIDAWRSDVYYSYFDSSESYIEGASGPEQHKIMETHKGEYYAMADVISYALDTMEPFYFVTIQELLESAIKTSDAIVQTERVKTLVETYSIKLVGQDDSLIGMKENGSEIEEIDEILDAITYKTYKYITYDTTYSNGTYTYTHVKDAVDEMEGAKFIIAYKELNKQEFTPSINGDYYQMDSTKIAEKYFYKEPDSSRYKSVDLYYYFNTDRDEYVKAPTYDEGSRTYYYKLGDQFYDITASNKDNFYYKDIEGEYHSIELGHQFYSDTKTYFYMPLVEGLAVGNNSVFKSEYIEPARVITARGFFDETSYPTAIKRTTSGDIIFYRDDLELVANGSVADFGTMDQVEVEGEAEEEEQSGGGFFQKIGSTVKGAFNSVKKFVTDLFNPLKLVPDLKLNESAMSTTYTNKTHSIHVLKEGKLHISYFFADSITSSLSAKLYGVNLNHIFDPLSINYVTLVIGSAVFLKIMITSVFGLINRSVNLFVLILIYPIACATIPLDESTGMAKSGAYSKWSNKYTQLLFSTYGLILGINFVFLILPVIDGLTFFTPEDLQTNKAVGRLATALYNPLTILPLNVKIINQPNFSILSNFINWLLRIIFEIAAFSLVTTSDGKGGGDNGSYYSVIQTVVGVGPGALADSPLDAVKKTLKSAAQGVNVVLFPHRAAKNAAKQAMKSVEGMKEYLPGSAILKEGKNLYERMSLQGSQQATAKALLKALKEGASKSDVEAKLKEYKSTHGAK